MIKTETREIRAILPETGTAKIIVPLYQRNYEWGKNEAEDLWNDITSSENGIFLGTVVFDVSKRASGEIAVVDGQQRLTTIFLFLVACRAIAQRKKNSELEAAINRKVAYCDDTTGNTTATKLIASPSVRDVFEFVVDGRWDGSFPSKIGKKPVKRQVNKIRPVYEYFKSKLDGVKDANLPSVLKKLYSSFAVVIEIDHDAEVFDLFERTNARGLELNAADLLKNHLFSTNATSSLEEIWEEIIENSQGTILRMLKYFWVSRRGYVQKRDLYPRLKQYSREVGAEVLSSELRDFANFYYIVRNGSEDELRQYLADRGEVIISGKQYNCQDFYRNLEALRLFRITQIYPILHSALHCYIRTEKEDDRSAKLMLKLMAVLENYHFVNNVVCQRIGNEVEKLYADVCSEFTQSDSFWMTASNLIKKLQEKRAEKAEFSSRFSEISYSQENIPLISYIFDRFGNYGRVGGQVVRIFYPDRRFFRRNWNIEHFFPQSKADLLGDAEDVDSIGNLFVISLHTNSQLQDKDPKDKLSILRAKELHNPHIAEFLDTYTSTIKSRGWSSKEIHQRTALLSESGYSTIWDI